MASSLPHSGSFLQVDQSATGQRWQDRLDQTARNTAAEIAQTSDVPELVARVLAGRGVQADEVQSFLNPALRELMPDPSTLTAMDVAARRVADAVLAKQRIAVFGDYDVDGAASSALLRRLFDHYGVPNEIYIPDRIFEGYGPNTTAIGELIDRGAELIITVDCGSTSFEALEVAAKRGIDVVVLDHHQMGTQLPACAALVNPNRQDDLSGLTYLCAAGVVFMTMVATLRVIRNEQSDDRVPKPPDLLQLLDLVALATVCDVVPLVALNRAFVVRGLEVMKNRTNTGLRELAKVSRMDGPPRPYHLGFLLGPRINAGGRIGDAALGARLLSINDEFEASEIAVQLEDLNKQRQLAEAAMLEEAVAEAEAEIGEGPGPSILITENNKWHPGIVGIVASRLKDRFKRPAFAIAFDGMGMGSGSGRSIAGVDLGAAVRKAVETDIVEKGGGHTMAAGLTVRREKLGELRAFLDQQLAEQVTGQRASNALKVDGALTARGATLQLIDLIESVGPFGAGHPTPVFAFPSHTVKYAKIVGRDHVSVTLSGGDGATLRAIAFRAADTELGKLLMNMRGTPLHVAGTLSADFWQGSRRVQLRIVDAAQIG